MTGNIEQPNVEQLRAVLPWVEQELLRVAGEHGGPHYQHTAQDILDTVFDAVRERPAGYAEAQAWIQENYSYATREEKAALVRTFLAGRVSTGDPVPVG